MKNMLAHTLIGLTAIGIIALFAYDQQPTMCDDTEILESFERRFSEQYTWPSGKVTMVKDTKITRVTVLVKNVKHNPLTAAYAMRNGVPEDSNLCRVEYTTTTRKGSQSGAAEIFAWGKGSNWEAKYIL